MQIVEYAKAHPVLTTIIVVIGGIIFIAIVRGSGGSSSSSGASGPSDAEIVANAQIESARIGAQASAAQAGAAVSAAQIGAGVQLNSDNKAAEIAMAQINAARDLQLENENTKKAAIASIGPFKGKGGYDEQKAAAIQTIFSGQNATIPINPKSPSVIPSIMQGLGSIATIFSDGRLKENIRHIGYDKRGRDIYEYNYRGSNTVRTGYIAQSIERGEPNRVLTDKRTGFKRIMARM